ncbi:MAG: sigma-70 family RNA polymerase sigma factor [Clostridia bacterium]|nr:sigma-70 family RNA polymerase sigma factor [Clostridia bacterium]
MNREEFARQVVGQTDRMYRVAYTLLRCDADCRDAMQEAALKAWEKRGDLREEAYFATWLTRILINECRAIQRKRARQGDMDAVPEPSAPPPDITLSLALQSLPEKLRLPLTLHAVEGMSYAEIAQVLRIPRTTVTGRIHRAKQQLRKELTV